MTVDTAALRVARLAEMIDGLRYLSTTDLAESLLAQGVTLPVPPPDPAEVVAEALRNLVYPEWSRARFPADETDRLLRDALRDLFTPETLAEAAKALDADR